MGCLDHSINYRRNVLYIHKQNSLEHELGKFLVAWELLQNESEIVTEAWFKQRKGRADVFELDTMTVYEVLETEEAARFNAKSLYYPHNVTIVGIKAEDIIKKHLGDLPCLKK